MEHIELLWLTAENRKQFTQIEREGYLITYELFESAADDENQKIYSVRVSITQNCIKDISAELSDNYSSAYYSSEKTAFDISRNRNTAYSIYNTLLKNEVTPCTLLYILDEIL